MQSSQHKYLLIFVLGLVIGLSILAFRNFYEQKTGISKSAWYTTELQEGDSKNFFDRAIAIYEGKHYYAGCENTPIVAFYRPPGYSFFMAFSFMAFGVYFKAIIILQVIIASMIIVLISKISDLVFNKMISSISSVLAIMYYPMWNNAMIINSELLSAFIGLLALYFILKFYFIEKGSIKNLIISGIFVGLASLTRGQFFFYSLLLPIFIFGSTKGDFRNKINYTFIWFGVLLMPILIWTLYAYISSGLFIFISSQGAYSIWWGWSVMVVLEEKYPLWNQSWDTGFLKDDMIGSYLPYKPSSWFLSESLNFIFKYPIESMKIAYYKFIDSWGFIDIYVKEGLFSKVISVLKFNWDLFLSIPGIYIIWKEKLNKTFLYYLLSAFIIFSVISVMTAGLVRYRIPYLDPLLIIAASVTIQKIYSSYILKNKTK